MVRVTVLLSVALAVLTACGGSPTQGSAEDPDSAGRVVSEAPLDNLVPALREASAQAKVMTYASRNGVNDAVSHVTGTVFVPKGPRRRRAFRWWPWGTRRPGRRRIAPLRCHPTCAARRRRWWPC